MIADEYIDLGKMYPSPGYCEEIIHIFLAKKLHSSRQHLDDDEFLEVYRLPFGEVLEQVMDGTIRDGKTQIAVLKTAILFPELTK